MLSIPLSITSVAQNSDLVDARLAIPVSYLQVPYHTEYRFPSGMSVPIVSFSLVRLVYRPKDFKKLRARMRVIDLLS